MPRTGYVSCTLLKVKPTFAENSYIVQPEFKIVKISLFSFIHDNNYNYNENNFKSDEPAESATDKFMNNSGR